MRIAGIIFTVIKWLLIAVIAVEAFSFIVIAGSNYLLYGHPREGSRAQYDPYTLFTMAHGLRKTAYNSSAADERLNRLIWMFGGSTTRGATERDERTIPSLLARILNAEGKPLHFTVRNLGVNSFNSLLEVKFLQKMLIDAERPPDLIIFYDGLNDAKYFAEHRTPDAHHGYRRVKALIESYYRSWFGLFKALHAAVNASFTKELWDKFHQVFVPLKAGSPEVERFARSVEKRYDHVDTIARCYGADFVVFQQPVLWVEDCPEPVKTFEQEKSTITGADRIAAVRRNFSIPYRAVARKLEGRPYFVNFENILCDRRAPAYQPDGAHLTYEGRAIVARRMADALLSRIVRRDAAADKTKKRGSTDREENRP